VIRVLLALALVLSLSSSLGAQEEEAGFLIHEAAPIDVAYLPGQEELARELAQRSLSLRAKVRRLLGVQERGLRTRLVLTASDALFAREFKRRAGGEPPPWVLAVAFTGSRRVIVRLNRGSALSSSNLTMTLAHELAHIAMREVEIARGEGLPRWLHEGLAMWASGEHLTSLQRNQLANAIRVGSLPNFESLAKSFPPHAASVSRAYLESLGFIEWSEEMAARRGGQLSTVVRSLGAGASIKKAFAAATGRVDPEASWRYSLADQGSFTVAVIHAISVWHVIALLAVGAIIRYAFSRRETLRKLDEDEAWMDSAEPYWDEG